ncbi:hypothetical protein HYH03_009065 [Edaphochlamys debaryana]|uniref:Retinoblastoma-like protein n=1 Tax=Edaphochlamys debaryana TaxID=47281 RepID=A0A835Y7X6_9CHLO|nr:hypothetical protein HYH03_009065 [Edaphochlamys debaryana]|eukprot:KAG2492649.1 hypothetical protein HYH03_009065 [Edaphochlamys debaryana]
MEVSTAATAGVELPRLLKGLCTSASVGGGEVQSGVLKLFSELKECYEAQERVAPAEYAGDQDEDVRQACKQASLLFVARVLFSAQTPEGGQQANTGLSISRIVAAAGINLLDFFREVNVVVSKLSPYLEAHGSSSKTFGQQAQLKEHSETVVVMGLLAKKYKDNFNTFLHQLDFYKQVVLRLGWNAFLVVRVKLLSAFPDVVSCVELLPCVFAVLVSHAPRMPDSLAHITSEGRAALLKSMADVCKADFSRVKARMPSVEALLVQILTTAVPEWRTAVAAARAKAAEAGNSDAAGLGAGLDLVAAPVLEGLVSDPERMQLAVAALEREYEQHYTRGGSELDERDFLGTDFTKFASPRFSPGAMHSALVKMRGGPMPLRPGGLLGPGAHTTAPSHPPLSHPGLHHAHGGMAPGLTSPLPMMHLGAGPGQPGTPVSEVMGASAWLRGITASLPAEPSAALQRFLAAVPVPAGAAPASSGGAAAPSAVPVTALPAAQQLARRVRDLVAAVMPEETAPSLLGPFPLLQPSLAAERRLEATKLYYHSLEAILTAEERVSGMQGATALLSSTKFHRGLIACCVEVVAACYRMVSCAFPKVLDALRIKAFDLGKMIQSFVKSIATLPWELKRHMFQIEEKILECLAWEPGSSLYHLIVNVHSENEAAAAAAAQEATAACSAASGDDSQNNGSGSKAGQSSSSAAAGGDGCEQAGGAASSSHQTEQSEPAPMDVADGSVAAPSPAPAAPPAGAPPPSPKRTQGSAFSSMMSPAKKARGADGAAHGTQLLVDPLPICVGAPPPGGVLPGGSAGALFEFCRKVLKLVAFRLALMCENFDFSPLDRADVNVKVYETIEYALYRQTHLFYNRHIDQVMLSALYGYCKVHKLSQVSFREIIAQYRKQPQAQQAVFRSVVIEQSNPGLQITSRADIIAFYNQVFVPSMKLFLLKAESGSGTSGPGADAKPAHAGNSGTAAGPAAGAAPAGGGMASNAPPGLPPLPPRAASQSPRGPKPPLPGAAPSSLRTAGRSGNVAGAREEAERNGDEAVPCPAHGPAGSSTGAGSGAQSPVRAGDSGNASAPPAGARQAGGAGSPTNGAKGAHARGRGSAAAEHKIPEGLAALLQALDSQQGEQEEEAEDEEAEPAPASGPNTRAGRGSGGAAAADARGPRERAMGGSRERRSARQSEAREDAMEAEGPGDSGAGEQAPLVTGRRQRTPNRRYGADV